MKLTAFQMVVYYIEAKIHFLLVKQFVALLRILPLIVYCVNIMFIGFIVLKRRFLETANCENVN